MVKRSVLLLAAVTVGLISGCAAQPPQPAYNPMFYKQMLVPSAAQNEPSGDDLKTLLAKNDLAGLKAYMERHPEELTTTKNVKMRLRFTGPAELRIIDIEQLVKDGNKDALIIAQIQVASGPYKKFSSAEKAALKKMAISEKLVTAMMAVTAKLKKEQKLLAEQQRTPPPAPVQLVRQVPQPPVPPPAPAPVVNTVAECLKQTAAFALCDQAGGLLSFGCKALARTQFNCPGM